MKRIKSFVIVIALLLMVGCSPYVSPVQPDNAKSIASKITYVRDDRTGLCFGLVGMTKVGEISETGTGITYVPCDKVESFLVK
jgi:hypothetical protein